MGFSDPSFVVDRVTGTVFLFCVCSFDWGWHDSANRAPHHPREVLEAVYLSSPDGGETWTGPVSVTDALNAPEDPWTARFASSGEGIQLRHKSPGRLIQQFTIRRGADRGVYAVSLYSDDHGHTWRTGELVGLGVDENKTVELSDGRIMLNSRPATPGTRLVAVSTDAGHSYTTPKPDPHLPDPANNGSIMRLYPDASPGSDASQILVFSGANSTASRRNGTLRMSYDDGATWPAAHEFQPGQMQYSTATPLADGSIGVLYEHTYSTIYFTRVS